MIGERGEECRRTFLDEDEDLGFELLEVAFTLYLAILACKFIVAKSSIFTYKLQSNGAYECHKQYISRFQHL